MVSRARPQARTLRCCGRVGRLTRTRMNKHRNLRCPIIYMINCFVLLKLDTTLHFLAASWDQHATTVPRVAWLMFAVIGPLRLSPRPTSSVGTSHRSLYFEFLESDGHFQHDHQWLGRRAAARRRRISGRRDDRRRDDLRLRGRRLLSRRRERRRFHRRRRGHGRQNNRRFHRRRIDDRRVYDDRRFHERRGDRRSSRGRRHVDGRCGRRHADRRNVNRRHHDGGNHDRRL